LHGNKSRAWDRATASSSSDLCGIIYNLLTLVVVAIFGLPAVAIIIILKLIGISIPAL
jgi:hypothetical protein